MDGNIISDDMAIEEVVLVVFAMCVGGLSLYLCLRRQAIVWSIISFVIFISLTVMAWYIPFVTEIVNGEEQNMGSPFNVLISGISLIFAFISLLFAFRQAFNFFKSKAVKRAF